MGPDAYTNRFTPRKPTSNWSNGVAFAKELVELPWGRFASFLDTEGNEFGLRE